MNKLNIICSKEQGDLLNELFKQQSQSSSITIEEVKNKESYGHWLEYTNVAITIIASSITIIDTVIKWFKKVKENKEEQVNITINQINYNSLEIGKLEEKLNELKEKLNE
jgi:vacuolar-type H+-ATPase subunit I/STV1